MDGLLNIDKPAGMTSHDVVARVRRAVRNKRAGHAGTLDPDAIGVLVVAVGQATRLLPHLSLEPKVYVARVVFGAATDTEDASGKETSSADASALTEADVLAVLPSFLGEIEQIPPMVSAVHHEGKRLYELARAGITVERESRRVMIHSLTLSDFTHGERAEATLAVTCGGGTYIRTLCADIGEAVGLPAHMKTLVRTSVGRFHRDAALTLDALMEQGTMVPMLSLEAALDLPTVEITDEQAIDIGHGRAISVVAPTPNPAPLSCGAGEGVGATTEIALLYRTRLIALAQWDVETGTAQPFKVFPVQPENS